MTDTQDVKQQFETVVREAQDRAGGTLGVLVQDLLSDLVLAWNDHTAFPTASTMKVPLLYALYRLAENGELDLTTRVPLKPDERVPGSGVLQHLDAGLEPTLRDLAELMIIVSDNYATDLIYQRVGKDRMAAVLAEIGLDETHLPHTVWELLAHMIGMDGGDTSITYDAFRQRMKTFDDDSFDPYVDDEYDRSTPADMVKLMIMIENGDGLSADSREGMLSILKHQNFNDRIPGRFPDDPAIEVAHKTGSVRGCRNDVGIVYTATTQYAIALMSRDLPDANAAVQELAGISKWVLDTMQERAGD